MATVTVDCSAAGTSQAVTLKSKAVGSVQFAEIFVEPSGTYDQSATESIELTNAASAIQNSRRSGKAVTLIDAMGGQSAKSGSTEYHFRTAVVNSGTIDCTIFVVGGSELANGAIPTFGQPLGVIVSFTEAD